MADRADPSDRVAYRTATAASMSDWLRSGEAGAPDLVEGFADAVQALDRSGPMLRSVLEINPDAASLAQAIHGDPTGALAGIPILLKDNIDTGDAMRTTAGSFALADSPPIRDSAAARLLRSAGAVLVGKANMSEWANFRSIRSTSGWSARGGLTRNPHALDRSAGGSSSGSAVAVAAGLVPLAIGTETDGSILYPAAVNGVIGLKPTVGLVPTDGVVPISHGQDAVGPFARCIADAATALAALAPSRRAGYLDACRPGRAQGLRIGVLQSQFWTPHHSARRLGAVALEALRSAGVTVIEDVDLPGAAELAESGAERTRLLGDFRRDMAAYLVGRGDPCPRSIEDLVVFNNAHRETELAHFGQELFEAAVAAARPGSREYDDALAICLRCSREQGIDAALSRDRLDCVVAVCFGPAEKSDLVNGDRGSWLSPRPNAVQVSAVAGYPALSVPIGAVDDLPIGLTIIGGPGSEAALLAVGGAIEQDLGPAAAPRFRACRAG